MEYKILVVDDEPAVRRTATRFAQRLAPKIVTGLDLIVEQAESGDEALPIIGIFSPDLIIMDTEMPGSPGYKICKQVKDEYSKGIYFVGMSSIASYADTWTTYGADSFLRKPFDLNQFKFTLETALGR